MKKYEETNHAPYHCNFLLLEVYTSIIENKRNKVTNNALHILTNYLFDIEVWGYYELRLYNSTLFLLPPNLVITFSKTVYNKSELFKRLPLLHNVLIRILLNTITYLTGGQNPYFAFEKETSIFIKFIEKIQIPETDLHARLALQQAKGFLKIRLGETDEGIEVINKTISIYQELGAEQLANRSIKYLQILLNNQRSLNK